MREMLAYLTARAPQPEAPAEAPSETPRVAKADLSGQATTLDANARAALVQRHLGRYDAKLGGFKNPQKFVEPDSVEFDLHLAAQGDDDALARMEQTLLAATALIDPVWGGAYQYSVGGVWNRPHFEKLMRTQARYLRLYAPRLRHQT